MIAILEPGGEDALRRALVEGPRPLFPPVEDAGRRRGRAGPRTPAPGGTLDP